jgi:hypothetical protein
MSSRTGFLMQGDSAEEESANTGSDWQVKQEHGWGSVQDAKDAGYFGAGFSERVDGRILDWNWDQVSSDDAGSWQRAIESESVSRSLRSAEPTQLGCTNNPTGTKYRAGHPEAHCQLFRYS